MHQEPINFQKPITFQEPITLLLCGDVMIGRSFDDLFDKYPDFNIWGNTLDIINSADFFGINLETTITDSQYKYPDKMFNFKLSPKHKNVLKDVTYANLANNHILDYNETGLVDTITNLDSLGIKHTGAGRSIKEAEQYVIITIKGLKIGILSGGDHPYNFAAGIKTPGINFVDINDQYSRNKQIENVKRLKPYVDIIIYSIHHGKNYVDLIPDNTIKFFHDLIDNGVNIIHGHSAHHVLPIEKYRNHHRNHHRNHKHGWIFYSMGDFIDDYYVDKIYRNDLSYLASIKIIDKQIKMVHIYPVKISTSYYGIIAPQVNLLDKNDFDYEYVINKIKNGRQIHHKNRRQSRNEIRYHKYKSKYNKLLRK